MALWLVRAGRHGEHENTSHWAYLSEVDTPFARKMAGLLRIIDGRERLRWKSLQNTPLWRMKQVFNRHFFRNKKEIQVEVAEQK